MRPVILLATVLSLWGCSAPVESQEPSLAYKMAFIHHGGEPPNEIAMHTFAGLLDSLNAKCAETPTQIADLGMAGKLLLDADGIEESLLEFFANLNESVPDEWDGLPCDEVFAGYLALRSP